MKPIRITLAAALAVLLLSGCTATDGGQAGQDFYSSDVLNPLPTPAPINNEYDPVTGTVQPQ